MYLNNQRMRQVGRDDGKPLGFHGIGDTTGAPLPLAPSADPTAAYLAGQAAGVAQGTDQGQTDLLNSLAAQGYSLTSQTAATPPAASSGVSSNLIFLAIAGVVTVMMLKR